VGSNPIGPFESNEKNPVIHLTILEDSLFDLL